MAQQRREIEEAMQTRTVSASWALDGLDQAIAKVRMDTTQASVGEDRDWLLGSAGSHWERLAEIEFQDCRDLRGVDRRHSFVGLLDNREQPTGEYGRCVGSADGIVPRRWALQCVRPPVGCAPERRLKRERASISSRRRLHAPSPYGRAVPAAKPGP